MNYFLVSIFFTKKDGNFGYLSTGVQTPDIYPNVEQLEAAAKETIGEGFNGCTVLSISTLTKEQYDFYYKSEMNTDFTVNDLNQTKQ